MKRGVFVLLLVCVFTFSAASVSASPCVLNANLINQDPYPTLPGEYVKLVFQVEGIGNPTCKFVGFEIIEEFPFSLDPGTENSIQIRGGTFAEDFKSFLIAPYRVRVHEDAIDGENEIKVRYFSKTGEETELFSQTKSFNISVQDLRTDFEISIKDYDGSSNILLFEVLNIGERDVDALTIEIPTQTNIEIKGNESFKLYLVRKV